MVALLLPLTAMAQQKRDIHEFFSEMASGESRSVSKASGAVIEIDLSGFDPQTDRTVKVSDGRRYMFTNGSLSKSAASSWKGGPLIEVSNGTEVLIDESCQLSGGGYYSDEPVVKVNDANFFLMGGSVGGNHAPEIYFYSRAKADVESVHLSSSYGNSILMADDASNVQVGTGSVERIAYDKGILSVKGGTVAEVVASEAFDLGGELSRVDFMNSAAYVELLKPLAKQLTLYGVTDGQVVAKAGTVYVGTVPQLYKITSADLANMKVADGRFELEIGSLTSANDHVTARVASATEVSITDLEPGTLPDRISNPDVVEELTITGRLNADDINLIRSMACKKLRALDISGCYIVEGGKFGGVYNTVSFLTKGVYFNTSTPVIIEMPRVQNDVIGEGMFGSLTTIESIELPNSVSTIEAKAFSDCPALRYVTIGEKTQFISSKCVFTGSSSLSLVTLRSKAYFNIVDGVMYTADNKTVVTALPYVADIVKLQNTTDSIAPYAFYGLKHVTIPVMPEGLRSIGEYAFCESGVVSLTFPSTLRLIDLGAFYACQYLGEAVFPEQLETIGHGAFAGCNLSVVDLSKTQVKTLYGNGSNNFAMPNPHYLGTFQDNNNVTTIWLPATMEQVGRGTFTTEKLTDIYTYATVPPAIVHPHVYKEGEPVVIAYDGFVYKSSFQGVDANTCRVHVPMKSKASYVEADGWKEFLNLVTDLPDDFDPNLITDADWLQKRLDEIAAEKPSMAVELTIQEEGIVLPTAISFKNGCKVILKGGKMTVDAAAYTADMVFVVDEGADVTFEDVTIDFANIGRLYFYNFINRGRLTIGNGVVYENISTLGTEGYFYANYEGGTLWLKSGDVTMDATVLYNEGSVQLNGGSLTGTGDKPVIYGKGSDVVYMYEGCSVIGSGTVVVDATTFNMWGGLLQGSTTSILVASRTACSLGGGRFIGGSTFGNGMLGSDNEEAFPSFELTTGRIDVTTTASWIVAWGMLPEIYMGKDAVIEKGVTFRYGDSSTTLTINADWKNMASGHVLIKELTEEQFNRIKFTGFPYSDARWSVRYDAASRTAYFYKMSLQEWLDYNNDADEDTGTEEEPVEVLLPETDGDEGDLWEGDDIDLGKVDLSGTVVRRVHYWWRDVRWVSPGTSVWPLRPTLRLKSNIRIYRGSTLRWTQFYLSGADTNKYIYVYGTLIIDVDVYIRYFKYRFIHVMPGGRVIWRGGRSEVEGQLIYNEGGTVEYSGGDSRYTGSDFIIDNPEGGNFRLTGGSLTGNIRTGGHLWLSGSVSVGHIWLYRTARIHILSRLTSMLYFRFVNVGDFELDVPIIYGDESYKLTEEDLKWINIELPEGYVYVLVDGSIVIRKASKPDIHELFKDAPEDNDEDDPYKPDVSDGADVDEDTKLPDIHVLFGDDSADAKTGSLDIHDCTLTTSSLTTKFTNIALTGTGGAHIDAVGKVIIGKGTVISGFQRFIDVKQGGSIVWQGGVTTGVTTVINNVGGYVELISGQLDGTVKSNTDITANGSVVVRQYELLLGTFIRVTGRLTTHWTITFVTADGSPVTSASQIVPDLTVLVGTAGYELTEEDLANITVALPDGCQLVYDATLKAIIVKGGTATAIAGVKADTGSAAAYDLQGRQVTGGLQKGQLYLRDGKKFIAK